jgi:hypothetical protein
VRPAPAGVEARVFKRERKRWQTSKRTNPYICEGALVEAFEVELAKVIKNIMDPNTEAKAKRSITMTVDFHPKDDRVQINVESEVKTRLAGLVPANSRIFVAKDADGVLYALDEDPRQMHIFTPAKPVEAPAPIVFSSAK